MDVCDVKVTDENVLLASNTMIKAENTLLRENWIIRAASEIVFQPLHLELAPNLRVEFCLRDVADGMRSPWKLHVGGLEEIFRR